jgi:hypothetical protein
MNYEEGCRKKGSKNIIIDEYVRFNISVFNMANALKFCYNICEV